ncbi:hypothetical protein [Streptomyces gobiensis]|uniref:hypothetical protein n=1 Tax=Streptomyces gobiensis TaxID=2875706 RepID=UPI001E3AEE65|nr:hypothetical protein [Streptomyces gobiensis]UGY90528.1 hypothetical protein test1122_01495 [Streptomyces gobiensis]
MTVNLSSVIAATTRWLTRAYPAAEGALSGTLAEAQARQAVTVAAWLRYPTAVDAELVMVVGPGGSGRLDQLCGADPSGSEDGEYAWRTWVDEVLVSWAACLLTSPALADAAVAEITASEHASGSPVAFRRLTAPDALDRAAAPLLRHPDLLAPVADLHRAELRRRLGPEQDPDGDPESITAD